MASGQSRGGLASEAWKRYDPNPPSVLARSNMRFVPSSPKAPLPDAMADYVEGATWWIARSDESVKSLLRSFKNLEVPCVLYECTGAMKELGREGKQYKIAIQLARQGWDIDVALTDAGIILDEVWEGD